MTQSPLHKLSPKDELDDSSLLHALIDSLPNHVYVKDAEGRYVLNNLRHAKALGTASPEEVAGKTAFDFFPRELAQQYRADEQKIIRSGQPLIDKEEPSVDEEGNEKWHSTTKVPLRDESGKVIGLVSVTRDITERKELEELERTLAILVETAYSSGTVYAHVAESWMLTGKKALWTTSNEAQSGSWTPLCVTNSKNSMERSR